MIRIDNSTLHILLPEDLDFEALSETYPDVKKIHIKRNPYIDSKASLRGIENFKGVEEIYFDDKIKPTDLKFLNGCENLKQIVIRGQMDFKEVAEVNVQELHCQIGSCNVKIERVPETKDKKSMIIEGDPYYEKWHIIRPFSLKGLEQVKDLVYFGISQYVKVEDLEVLYKCKDLERLFLAGQRDIKEIDVSKLSKLYYLDLHGCGVKLVKGMNLKEPQINSYYNFGNCSQLKKIEGIETFMHKMVDNQSITQRVLVLDDVFYQKLMTKQVGGKFVNSELEQKLIHEQERKGVSSIGIVTEFCDDCRVAKRATRGTPLQMKVQRQYLYYVMKKECNIQDKDSDWEKVKKAYDWVTETFYYAHGLLSMEKKDIFSAEISPGSGKGFWGEDGYDHYYIGSTYFSLFERRDLKLADDGKTMLYSVKKGKYAVCEGIANVYVQMLEQIGVEAHCVLIDYVKKGETHEIETGHAFVAAKIDGEYRYFDPTWDLGETVYSQFGLSFEQAKERHFDLKYTKGKYDIEFLNEEERFAGAKDIQSKLEGKGLLERYKEENKNQAEELKKEESKKGFSLLDYFGSIEYAKQLLNTNINLSVRKKLENLSEDFDKTVVKTSAKLAQKIISYFNGIPTEVGPSIFGLMSDFYKKTRTCLNSFIDTHFKNSNMIKVSSNIDETVNISGEESSKAEEAKKDVNDSEKEATL